MPAEAPPPAPSGDARRPFARPSSGSIVAVFFFVIVLSFGALLWVLGAVPQRDCVVDTPVLLDGAWRVLQGQRPHVDFHTPLGPVTFLILASGMRLAGPTVGGVASANAILFVLLSVWGWALSRSRMTQGMACLSGLCAGFAAAGASVYGYAYLNVPHLGYAALYNRYGEALTALVLIESFWRLRSPNSRMHAALGGASTGVLLVLLFFLKVSFFAVALLAVALGAVLRPLGRARWIGLVLGAALAGGLMLAYLHFDWRAVAADLAMAIAGRTGTLGGDFSRLLSGLGFTLSQVYLLLVLWWCAPAPARSQLRWLNPKLEQGLLVCFFVVAQFMIFWTCNQAFGPTLFAWGALLVLQGRWENPSAAPASASAGAKPGLSTPAGSWRATSLLAAIPIGLPILVNIASIGFVACLRVHSSPRLRTDAKFDSVSLSDYRIHPQAYVDWVNDGLALLRGHSGPLDRLLTLDFSNPFSFGLLRPSPKGDLIWWDRTTCTRRSHLPPDKVFADVTVVLVPKGAAALEKTPEVPPALLFEIYGPTITREFVREAESEYWTLYRRNR